jgi:hypothetical protein
MKDRILKNLISYHRKYVVDNFDKLDMVKMQKAEKAVKSLLAEQHKQVLKKHRFKKNLIQIIVKTPHP